MIKKFLDITISGDKKARELVDRIEKTGDLIFFGGCIRDYLLYPKTPLTPRDFDVAISFRDKIAFKSIIEDYPYKKNRFGGYKVQTEKFDFDLWDIQDTWAFKNKLVVLKEENIINTVFLNLDAVAYNWNENKLYDREFRKAIDSLTLDVVLEDNPQTKLNLLRVLVLMEKYKDDYPFKVSDPLIKKFKELILNEDYLSDLYETQINHYKKEIFTTSELQQAVLSMIK